MKPLRSKGFTLFELILLIVVFSGALGGLLATGAAVGRRLGENQLAAQATQAAQRVIETLLALRRDPEIGYAKIPLYPRAACEGFQLRDPVTSLPLPAYPLVGMAGPLQCVLSVEAYAISPCATAGVKCLKAVVTLARGTTPLAEFTLVMASAQ